MANHTKNTRLFDVTDENGVYLGRYEGKTPRLLSLNLYDKFNFVVNEQNHIPQQVHVTEYTRENEENITRTFLATKTKRENITIYRLEKIRQMRNQSSDEESF